MRKFEALYYPLFDPLERWLRKHLLVFDTIKTIVPQDVKVNYSFNNVKIMEAIPDAFDTVAPTQNDNYYDDSNIARISKAFKIVSKENTATSPHDYKLVFDKKDLTHNISGHSLIHNDKLTKKIVSLLFKHALMQEDSEQLANALGKEGFSIVNEKASNIIMASLADQIAWRKGLYSVTDLNFHSRSMR